MGLTRPRAHQLQDIDYKQTSRAITTTNITLSGGAPAVVDGVSLGLNDRVLVTGQSTGSENGIYSVTTVGAGSNGTWARSSDADGAGELNAGSITMVTEGTTYADTQWKLTTDDPITIGSTALTFVRNGAAAYGTFAVAGQNSIVADAVGDTLTMVAGTNLALTTNDGTDTLTITPSLTPAITSLTATGNISAGNLSVTGLGAFSGNVTIPNSKELQIGTGGDFTLQHDGTNSIIRDNNGHNTWIQTDGNILLSKKFGAGYYLIAYADLGVEIRYANSRKFETTSTGVKVTGDLETTADIELGHASDTTIARASAGVVTIEGAEVTTNTGTQTLTNKTLTSPTINAFSGTGDGSITGTLSIANTTTDDSLLITTTEDSSTAAPVITLKRNSASPADADYLGQLKFKGENDADQEVVYAKITGKIQDASDGSEDGLLEFANRKAGSNVITARLRSDSLQLLNGTTLVVAGLTYPTADGTNGQILQTDGSGTLSFADASGGGATVSSDTTTNTNFLLYFASTTTGALTAVKQDSGLTYNPSTGLLTSASFSGSGASLTALNGSNISTGTVAAARVATLNQNTTGTAGGLSSAVTVSLSGDVTGSATFTNAGDTASITTTIAANSVALGTDTTGNYVAAGAVSGTGLSGSASAEGATFTVTSNATSVNTASTIVARDGSGNFTAGVITATATAARYADLAEKYTSDENYDPGTVLELGGIAEVTQTRRPTSLAIAGIVSTDPAYLMNSDSEGISVALIGRVPCKVTGKINKGDILVSSDIPGHAKAHREIHNPPAGSMIGKAIEAKDNEEPGVIEVLVGRL